MFKVKFFVHLLSLDYKKKIHFVMLAFKLIIQKDCVQRTGLAEVRELVFRPPGTDDD